MAARSVTKWPNERDVICKRPLIPLRHALFNIHLNCAPYVNHRALLIDLIPVFIAIPCSSVGGCCINGIETENQASTVIADEYESQQLQSSMYKVVCYFTDWAWYRRSTGSFLPKDIDVRLCTHIVYSFAVLNKDTLTIQSGDPWADVTNHMYQKVVAWKRKGVKVSIAIGGGRDSAKGNKYSSMVDSPSSRSRFIASVISFIGQHNFDGLDLDWEYPKSAQDKQGFMALVSELRAAFEPKGLLLSAAVSNLKNVIDNAYDVAALSRDLNWIGVMGYDYHGQWERRTGHVAPLCRHSTDADSTANVEFGIKHWISRGVDPSKLVLGMPTYGISFTLANAEEHELNAPTTGGGKPGEFTRERGILSYYEICQRVVREGWAVVRDQAGCVGPYAYRGDQWVSYDDPIMIRHKSEWLIKMGLGGAMIWTLSLDDFSNHCGTGTYPLLKAVNHVLRGRDTDEDESQSRGVPRALPESTWTALEDLDLSRF